MNAINTSKLDILEAKLETLPPKSHNFAADLVRKGRKWGLSNKQMFWVDKFINGEVNAEPAKLEGFGAIVDLLTDASANLKYPKVRLRTEDGQAVVFGLAGGRARFPGSVNVTDGGRYGDNVWFGRIHLDGVWQLPGKEVADEVRFLVQAFADDPSGVASNHGHLSGNCAFCLKTLTDERSLDAGYGPVCAGNFGLPWGE